MRRYSNVLSAMQIHYTCVSGDILYSRELTACSSAAAPRVAHILKFVTRTTSATAHGAVSLLGTLVCWQCSSTDRSSCNMASDETKQPLPVCTAALPSNALTRRSWSS
jgi:hypothetical protein